MTHENEISYAVIGAALEVHRQLGPGLLESAYEECLAFEMTLRQIEYERQKMVPVKYKGLIVDGGFRLDFLVSGKVIVELKAVDRLIPVHEAQVLTYLKLMDCRLGLLINFNARQLVDGVQRIALNL